MSLVCWLPLQGNLNNQGVDNIATITATNASYETTGKIGQCIKLGYSSNFTIPSLVRAKQISIAYWVRINTATSTQWLDPIHYYSNTPDGTGSGWVTRQEFYSNCTLTGFWFDNGSVSGIGVTVGEWTHFAITVDYNAGVAKMYKNGVLVKTANTVNTDAYVTGDNFRIGENGLDLSECDVRIYNHILNAKEVSEIAKGLVLHYPLNNNGSGMLNLLPHTNISKYGVGYLGAYGSGSVVVDNSELFHGQPTLKITPSSSNTGSGASTNWNNSVVLAANKTYTYSCWIKSTVADTWDYSSLGHHQVVITDNVHSDTNRRYIEQTVPANTWTHVSQSFTTTAESKFYSFFIYFTNTSQTIWVSNIKLEEGDHATPWTPCATDDEYSSMGYNGTTIYDTSGYLHNGTSSGISYSSDTPRYSASTVFDANTDTVAISPCWSLNQVIDKMSVSIWFKTNTMNSTAPNQWSLGQNSFARIRIASETSIWYYMTGTSGTYTTKTLTDNVWHHCVFTFNGGIVTMYIDGEQVGQTDHSSSKPTLTMASTAWYLAGYAANYENFIGSLSDFRIYATCLTADQVLQMYNTPVSLTNNSTLLTHGEFIEQ